MIILTTPTQLLDKNSKTLSCSGVYSKVFYIQTNLEDIIKKVGNKLETFTSSVSIQQCFFRHYHRLNVFRTLLYLLLYSIQDTSSY